MTLFLLKTTFLPKKLSRRRRHRENFEKLPFFRKVTHFQSKNRKVTQPGVQILPSILAMLGGNLQEQVEIYGFEAETIEHFYLILKMISKNF